MGETVTVTATPNAGYELDEILVNGSAITGNTFEMPADNAEVTVTFKAIDYTITVRTPVNGTLNADKTTATVGETVNFTAEPATGYRLVEILVDGSAITGTSYTMPAKNITVTAVFEAISYNITVIAPTNGTLSANKTVAVYGEEVLVTATPAVGYKLVAIKVNGVAITDGKFEMPAEDVEITAEFELLPADEYSITIDTIVNGSVSADKTSAIAGETVNLTVVPDKHYKLVEVTVNGVALPEGATGFEMPAEHVLVSATFEEIPYAIRIDFPDTEYYFLLDTRYDNDDNVFEVLEKILFNAYGGRKQQGGLIKRFYDLAIEKAQNKGVITGLAIPTYLIEDSRTFDVAPGEIITGMTPEMIQRCRDDMKAMTAQEKREYLVDMLPAKVLDKAPEKAMEALEKALAKIPDADMNQIYNDGVDAIPDESFSISDSYTPGDAQYTIDLDWECDPVYLAEVYYENVYLKNRALDKLAEYGLTPTPEEWALYDLCRPSNFAKDMGDHHEILPVQDYYDLAHELLDAGEAAFRARDYDEYREKMDKALDKGVPKALAKAREKGLIIVDDKGNDITAEQIITAAKAWLDNPDMTANELIDIFGCDYVRITGSARGYTLNIMISRVDTSEL